MKHLIKNTIGKILILILPKKTIELSSRGLTIQMDLSIKERLIRNVLLERAKKKNDFDTLSNYHKDFWLSRGRDYFSSRYNSNILENFFKPNCSFLLNSLEEQLQKESGKYNMLVEIGTGDGSVLKYLSERFSTVENFVGIDLSASQIESNKKLLTKNPKLKFVAADGFDWIKKYGSNHMVVLTSRGVLEYFTQTRIQELFKHLSTYKKIIFIAIEPTGADHNFLKNPNSQIYGYENSFSHNYVKMFANSGFDIWHESKIFNSSSNCYMNFIGAAN